MVIQILDRRGVCQQTGYGPTKYWTDMRHGLLLPDLAQHELDALLRAKRAGWSDEARVELVNRLRAIRDELGGPEEVADALKAMQAAQPRRRPPKTNIGVELVKVRAAKKALAGSAA